MSEQAQDQTTPAPEPSTSPAPAAPAAPATGGVKCASCGQPANVPFTPDPSRPVYCRDCFAKRPAGGARGGGFRGRDGPRPGPRAKGEGRHGFSRFDYPGYAK